MTEMTKLEQIEHALEYLDGGDTGTARYEYLFPLKEQLREESQGQDGAETNPEKGLDEVYEDRNLLACALAESNSGLAGWTPAEENPDEWAIVFVETPHGQVSWHVQRELAEKLVTRDDGYEYDGHTREEKNDRLASWTEDGCWR